MQYSKFVVGDAPYCVWEWDLPGLFSPYSKSKQDDNEYRHYAAVAIRTGYCHGLGTLLSNR